MSEENELFARFDYSTSVTKSGDLLPWNYQNDGSFFIFGIQHTFSPNVKVAIDYQGTFPYSTYKKISDLLYVNALFKF